MNRVRQQFDRFISSVATDQFRPQQKFIREAIKGLLDRRSVLLSEIGRSLDEDTPLLYTEKRLSRNLASDRFDDAAAEQRYLEAVAPFLRDPDYRTPTIAVDLTDLIKPRAKAMPNLARVHDGSTGQIANGYMIVNVEAVGDRGRRLPLSSRLFSHKESGFKSELATTTEALRLVRPHVPDAATWVFDRGFEGRRHLALFQELGIRWAVRLTVPKHDADKGYKQRQRNLYVNGAKRRIDELVETVQPAHTFRVRKFSDRAKKSWKVSVGWIPVVRVQAYNKAGQVAGPSEDVCSLVVVRGTGLEPMVLLTNVPVWSADVAQEIANSYMERWGIEEAHRFCKQAFDLEDVRALTWRGLKRMVLLTMLAYGFLAVLVHGSRADIERIAKTFKAFGPVPTYLFYRLLEGVGQLLRRVTGRRP